MSEKYCIQIEGYESNPDITTRHNGKAYWSKKRLKAASFYQFYVYKFAKKIAEQRGISNIIDVGCGPALKVNKFFADDKYKIIGIDQKEPIKFCNETHQRGEYFVDDFNHSLLKLNTHRGLFICCDVIEHLVNPTGLLTFLQEKMDKESYLIISTPERTALRGAKNKMPTNKAHIREWNSDEFRNYLDKHGFEVVESHMLYPVKFSLNVFNVMHLIKQSIKWRKYYTNQCHIVKKS